MSSSGVSSRNAIIADRGYDARAIIDRVESRRAI
jgi:hypothetical protein